MKYDWDIFFEEKLMELSQEDFILDVGGGTPFQKRMAKYKNWFQGKRFATIDQDEKAHPTIVGDVHNLPLRDGEVDAILCNSVLEHLYDPKRAVEEICRVLKKGGRVLAYTHFIYPYHARSGKYDDYFRFTEISLRYLFRQFGNVEIKKQGGYFRAMMFFMPGQVVLKPLWEPIAYFLDKLFATEKHTTTTGYYVYATK